MATIAQVGDRKDKRKKQQKAKSQEKKEERTLEIDNPYYGVDEPGTGTDDQTTTVQVVENDYYGVYDELEPDEEEKNTVIKVVENPYYGGDFIEDGGRQVGGGNVVNMQQVKENEYYEQ